MTTLRRAPVSAAALRVRTPLTVVDVSTQERFDLLVDLDPTDRVADLDRAITQLLHPRTAGLWLGRQQLDEALPLAEAGLHGGCVVGLGGPLPPEQAPSRCASGAAEVHVVSGPGAGTITALEPGDTWVDGLLFSTGPAGVLVAGSVPDGVIRHGDSLLSVVSGERSEAVAFRAADLGREVTRPPRLRTTPTVHTVELPVPPTPVVPRKLPVLALLVPVLLGVVMAVLSSPLFLLFTLMSPVLAVSTWWTDRRSSRFAARAEQVAYEKASAAVDVELARLLALEARDCRAACPDPGEVLGIAIGPGRRLWERRRSDDDNLLLRIGTGNAVSATVRCPGAVSPVLDDVPVTVALREVGTLGLAGVATRPLARWLVGQAAALHSPRDLSIWLLVDPVLPDHDWAWLRWLPHGRPCAGQDCTALVGNDADSIAARVAELATLVGRRLSAARDVRTQLSAGLEPAVLVVLDGARTLRALPGMPTVLRDGPAVGVHVICLDERELLLPEECLAVVTADSTGAATLHQTGLAPVALRADLVSVAWADTVSRGLSPLRDAVQQDEAQIPASARLLEVLQLDPPTAAGVRARQGRTAAAVVGVDADGPFTLDLKRDGPHVLVAGTTGAGKSELLQTLVASLAVANRPDAMAFVLVDYKGGAAFKDCARLPHTVGMVTDLDGHLVERALASLTAELKTREHLLQAAGTKDLEDYWATGASLARLVIVIDEFASLVEDLPDFVRGLVGIAQRGRSLGVHLVLATQRPSGVVSPEIRANTNLRLALRVTDAAESSDVLDAPDAAAIARSTPGRAFARTGHTSLSAFQCARVGGRRPGAGLARPVIAVELPWSAVGAPPPATAPEGAPDDDATDLHALVAAVCEAAAGLPVPRSPWLVPLPPSVVLDDLSTTGHLLLPFGLEDRPAEQSQRPACLDLQRGGHLLVAGAARSGRTTFLRTLAASVARSASTRDVHLYVLDCGNGALAPLADLPHTGAVVGRQQVERADRLLARLNAEVGRRQELLAAAGCSDLAEQRAASAEPLPYLLLLVDRWEGFTAAFDDVDAGRMTDTFLHLLREGSGVGLRVVVTGDRSALIGKVMNAVEDVLVLRLAERSDYALAGLSPRQLPEHVGDGRGFRAGVEVQVALLCQDASGAAQSSALASLASRATLSSEATSTGTVAGLRPFRIDPLPHRISAPDAGRLPRSRGVPVGVGGDELSQLCVELDLHGPGFAIAGPPRSGRSTALLAVAHGLLAGGSELVVLAPRPSPLHSLVHPGIRHLSTSSEPDIAAVVAALKAARGPLAVVVDDAELLHQAAVAEVLSQVLRDGRDQGHALVLAGTTDELALCFRGFTADARKSRSGLLLGLTSHLDGELLGVRLPRSAVAGGPVGRGLLVRTGQVTTVQVPVPA